MFSSIAPTLNYMKTYKFIFLLMTFAFVSNANAQETKMESDTATGQLKRLVESGNYVFEAHSALPLKDDIQKLIDHFSLTITPNKVISDLPYFGQIYQYSPVTTDGGIKFTSYDFEYAVQGRKKGGWEVRIKAKDIKYSPQMLLTILKTGAATLDVNSSDRQAISYNGEIKGPKATKPKN